VFQDEWKPLSENHSCDHVRETITSPAAICNGQFPPAEERGNVFRRVSPLEHKQEANDLKNRCAGDAYSRRDQAGVL
jgi:hypothetical protein